MQGPMTFGECLTELLRKKHISVADLARRLNYRSKTSISRMLRDEVRYESIEDFMNRLEPMGAWLMTQDELTALKDAMEVSRLGRARYLAYQDIWRLVSAPKQEQTVVVAECFGSAQVWTLRELADSWHGARKLNMCILNSGYDSLWGELDRLLKSRPELDCSIRHYLMVNDAPGALATQLGSLIPVFHDPRYQGFYQTNTMGHIGVGGSIDDFAVIRGEAEDGLPFTQVLNMQAEDRCLLYEVQRESEFDRFFDRMVEDACSGALSLKTQYPEQELIEGLIVITGRYLSCEQDRSTYCLAPDVCFELIPYDILCRVMFDSVLSGFDPEEPQVKRLTGIHLARYNNIHEKKKPTVFMLSWESMKRFAETGRTTDHVAGMRAFWPEERAEIIRDVVRRCRENVYLSVRLLKPDRAVRGMTLTTHGGLGVYLLDSYTQYDVVKGHSEAFILMPAFASMREEFFKDELIAKHTYSEAESLEMLTSLADKIQG